jgi:hypothetical protein
MRTLLALPVLALAAFALPGAGCNSYDPSLSSRPFLCGPNQSCPGGYTPVSSGPQCVCTQPSGGGGGCEDRLEPNDLTSEATSTPVGSGAASVTFNELAICEGGDIDTFAFRTTETIGATATVTFDPWPARQRP